MLIDRRNLHHHMPWLIASVVITIAATIWYVASSIGQSFWPGGSSLPGFTFGVVGGLICIFEFLLWPRKKLRGWKLGPAKIWLRAHIWLGLLSVPLVIYHSGFRLGGALSTGLLILFILVILSGVVGLILQQFIPRRLLQEVPAETIYSQIDTVAEMFAREADRLVLATCGTREGHARPGILEEDGVRSSYTTIGDVRSAGDVEGKVLSTLVIPGNPVPGSEPLREFHEQHVEAFLLRGGTSGSALRFRDRSAVMFQDLRTKLDPEAHDVVNALETLCDQRRQFNHQASLHFWLHSWLWIHLPLSSALMVLLFVHIYVALKY